jgi:Zn-dependent peptidase ImmA (M78 family)
MSCATKIRELALGLVRRYGTFSPAELCDYLSVRMFRCELPEQMGGVSFQTQAGAVILLSRKLTGTELRYCCAHELGHVLLHPGLNAQTMADCTNFCIPRFEHEADLFAACLLIEPSLGEWQESYDSLTVEQIACLAGLPIRVVNLWQKSR